MTESERSERPRYVTFAVGLLGLVVLIGFIQAGMVAIRHIDVRSPGLFLVSKITLNAFYLLLLYQIARGRSWAR